MVGFAVIVVKFSEIEFFFNETKRFYDLIVIVGKVFSELNVILVDKVRIRKIICNFSFSNHTQQQ